MISRYDAYKYGTFINSLLMNTVAPKPTKEEQITKLKQTIQEAQDQVTQLQEEMREDAFPKELKTGQVVQVFPGGLAGGKGIYVVCELLGVPNRYVLQNLNSNTYYSQPKTFEALKKGLDGIKVLAQTVDEYYNGRE